VIGNARAAVLANEFEKFLPAVGVRQGDYFAICIQPFRTECIMQTGAAFFPAGRIGPAKAEQDVADSA